MATMRAKLVVTHVDDKYEGQENLEFNAVCADEFGEDGTDENNTYSKYTPFAELKMMITNEALHGQFQVGDEFYVDFTRCIPVDKEREAIYDLMFERNLSFSEAKEIIDGNHTSA